MSVYVKHTCIARTGEVGTHEALLFLEFLPLIYPLVKSRAWDESFQIRKV